MKIEEIDKEIKKLRGKVTNPRNFIQLISLIEEKIRLISRDEDLKHFFNYIQRLNLSEYDIKKLNFLRNSIFHSRVSDNAIVKEKAWFDSVIIPAILNYEKKDWKTEFRKFENEIIQKLEVIGQDLGYEVKKQPKVKIGTKKTLTYIADLVMKKNDFQIVIEIKNTIKDDRIATAINQLLTYCIAFNTKFGILMIPGSNHESFEHREFEILIFGAQADFKVLRNWLLSKR